jgi:hypothetical protein
MAEPFRYDYPTNPYRVDPIYLRMTEPRGTNDGRGSLPSVQSLFGELSVTSQFKVSLFFGETTSTVNADTDINSWLVSCGVFAADLSSLRYEFMCHSAALPGVSLGLFEETGSRQGVVEKFPTIRQYPEVTFEFYVDAEYGIIRLFEEWINFINPLYVTLSDGKSADRARTGSYRGSTSNRGSFDPNDFYRMRYPDTYKRKLAITKFERDIDMGTGTPGLDSATTPSMLTYEFINAFPVNLTALPVSYEGSTITKTTVTFTYDRYVVLKHWGQNNSQFSDPVTSTGSNIVMSSPTIATGSPTGQNTTNIAFNPSITLVNPTS